jgi:hypothetical protein
MCFAGETKNCTMSGAVMFANYSHSFQTPSTQHNYTEMHYSCPRKLTFYTPINQSSPRPISTQPSTSELAQEVVFEHDDNDKTITSEQQEDDIVFEGGGDEDIVEFENDGGEQDARELLRNTSDFAEDGISFDNGDDEQLDDEEIYEDDLIFEPLVPEWFSHEDRGICRTTISFA